MGDYIIRTDIDALIRKKQTSADSYDGNTITFFIQNREDWITAASAESYQDTANKIRKVEFEVLVGEGAKDFALSVDINKIKYKTNTMQQQDGGQNVEIYSENDKKIISCTISKPKRSIRLTLYDIVTTAAVGETEIAVYVNGKTQAGKNVDPDGVITMKKQDALPQIKSFWPNKGAVFAGEKIILQYQVENATKLVLQEGRKIIPLSITSHQYDKAAPLVTTLYKLIADDVVTQSFPVIVADVYMRYFKVEGDTLMWSVHSAKQLTVNGELKTESEGTIDIADLTLPAIITLEATGLHASIISRIYVGDDVKRAIVPHFQKTMITIGSHQLVQVSWKTHTLDNLDLIYKDRERFEIYPIHTMKENVENENGEWEQLVLGNYIDITMEAMENGKREPIYITL